jgi:hypothetical protein
MSNDRGWLDFPGLPMFEEPEPYEIKVGDVIQWPNGQAVVVDELLEPSEDEPGVKRMRVHVKES